MDGQGLTSQQDKMESAEKQSAIHHLSLSELKTSRLIARFPIQKDKLS